MKSKRAHANTFSIILDTWITHFRDYYHIPGIAVGVIKNNQIQYQNCFGVSNVVTQDPITPHTYFHIASISKSITAIAIFKLIEARHITLKTPVVHILPEICSIASPFPLHTITIEHLLSHTSGLPRDGASPHWESDQFPTREALRAMLPLLTTYAPAGAQFKYSNLGYALLGLVIETISGISYASYVKKHILKPYRLHTIHIDTPSTTESYATGYGLIRYDTQREHFLHAQTHAFAPATGYAATLTHLLTLLQHFDPAPPTTVMPQTRYTAIRKHKIPTEHNEYYSLGFEIEHHGTHTMIGHTGGFAGFSSKFMYDPKRKLGVIVLMNTHDSRSSDLVSGILNAYDDCIKKEIHAHSPNIFGHYQSRYDNMVIAPYGKDLLAFHPKSTSPTRDGLLCTPTKHSSYRIARSSPFESCGESVSFIQSNPASNAHTVLLGAHPYTRVP